MQMLDPVRFACPGGLGLGDAEDALHAFTPFAKTVPGDRGWGGAGRVDLEMMRFFGRTVVRLPQGFANWNCPN